MTDSIPAVPPVRAFYWSALQTLLRLGTMERTVAVKAIVDSMGLAGDQLAIEGPGRESLAEYRAGWALSHLKLMGLVDNAERGNWQALPSAKGVTEDDVLELWRDLARQRREKELEDTRQTWLVGAMIGGADQTARFVRDGVWEISTPTEREAEYIHSMEPGDRIAIKASFTQKYQLPFANNERPVSVMRIKARGRIKRVADGEIYVDWEELSPPRDWYFYTGRTTIWRLPHGEMAEALEAFIFDDLPQDYDTFLADPYWAEKYRGPEPESQGLDWIPFYEAVADELLRHRDRRAWLADLAARIRSDYGMGVWHDKFDDGSVGRLADIDPGTFMSIFNFGPTPLSKRQQVAQEVAEALGVDLAAPEAFEGIPTTHPQKAWLFSWQQSRGDAVDRLWDVFRDAVRWADHPEDLDARAAFAASLGPALEVSSWQLLTALYRARPMAFCPMDGNTRALLAAELGVRIPASAHFPDAADHYLDLLDRLTEYLERPDSPVHTIPEFSLRAWSVAGSRDDVEVGVSEEDASESSLTPRQAPYTVDDLVADGCFVPRPELDRLLRTLRTTKNLILQGAPGTGKTWLAKRLGWVLAGRRSATDVQVVQFHPNTSYEDFVRGYRPTSTVEGAATLKLVDGPFLRLADQAREASDRQFTMVIEEINRGNPARALGEVLTLIEGSKRTREDAIRLTYPRPETEPDGVWLPPNLFTIGTMNIADRSLALVDLALRRRFAFVTLQPQFTDGWRSWMEARVSADDAGRIDAIAQGVQRLNAAIAADPTLGPSFVIGHSFFTLVDHVEDINDWFIEQVESSVRPLLHEYWFDNREEADRLADQLRDSVT